MYINDENFELVSDFEVDMLLSEMPIELIKENISEQIKSPLSTRTNFISVLEDSYRIIDDLTHENLDEREKLLNTIRDFFTFTLMEMDREYDLSIDLDSITSDEDLINKTTAIYSFLILRYKKNICKFLYSFIKKNRKSILEQFQDVAKKKDVTSISLKKQIKNKDVILLISNLSTIIKYILSLEIDAEDFIQYACDDEYYEGSIVLNMVYNGEISNNFVGLYTQLIMDEYDSVLDEIQNEVKIKILKK